MEKFTVSHLHFCMLLCVSPDLYIDHSKFINSFFSSSGNPIFAARRSDGFQSVYLCLTGGQKRFWSQLNNSARCPPIGGVGKTPRHSNSTKSHRRRHFGPFSNFDKCRLEVAGDVLPGRLMEPDVPDNRVKYCYPRVNHSREIPPEAV